MHLTDYLRRLIRAEPTSDVARYHFIHIPKNAGNSVRAALASQPDVSLSQDAFHHRYVDIADHVGTSVEYFAVVRNPWSRTASRFVFGRQNAGRWSDLDPRRQYILRASFADFVRDQPVFPIPEHPGKPWMGPLSSWYNQLEWIRDESGQVAASCLRMEHLDRDIPAYLGRPIKIRRRNATHHKYDYRSMYTDELAEIVARLFRADIEHFGFTFEGSATRNVVSA